MEPDKPLDTPIAAAPPKKGLLNPKIFFIGLPVFVLQLVVVYFVTANILLSKIESTKDTGKAKTETTEEKKEGEKPAASSELGKHIFNIEDLIVNPAGTNGQRLMLTSVGFDIASEEQLQNIKSKEVLIKDIVISVLASKTLDKLTDVAYRDTLKTEMSKNIVTAVPNTKINSIYFSKYIIQ